MLRADSDADEGAAATSRTLQLVTLCAAIWAPTFLAELVELSGIVATLFAAIGVRHWATPNLQSSSTVDAKPVANAVLSTLAHLADTIIFLYLGLSVPAKTRDWTNDYSHSLTFWAILACLIGRAAHVYPLSRPVWKSNFRRPTPSTRRLPCDCVCSMTWRLTDVSHNLTHGLISTQVAADQQAPAQGASPTAVELLLPGAGDRGRAGRSAGRREARGPRAAVAPSSS